MSVLRTARLRNEEGGARRLCEIDLVELGGEEPRHVVNVRLGKEGRALLETTRTPTPVTLAEARRIFDSAVVSKLNQGFRDSAGGSAALSARRPDAPAAQLGERLDVLRRQLDDVAAGRLDASARDKLLFRAGLIADPALADAVLGAARGFEPDGASHALIHALARCARERAATALDEIARSSAFESARDLARYARSSRWMGELSRPDPDDAGAIDAALSLDLLAAGEARRPGSASAALIALGRRGPSDVAARERLLELLGVAQPRPPFLRAFRRLFKFAELGDDAELFAVTARALEREAPMYKRGGLYRGQLYWRAARGMVSALDEAKAPSPRFALSDQTSFYLRRRIWRALRKRAELGHASFTEMAGALAARFEEADFPQGPTMLRNVRDVWSLSHLLYADAARVRFDAGTLRVSGAAADFEPPFPQLWTRDARSTLRMAVAARSRPARAFAASRLALIPPERLSRETAMLVDLAGSSDPALAAVAAKALEPIVSAPGVPADILARLLDTPSDDLRRLVLLAVAARPGAPWSEVDLGLAALSARHPETSARVEMWLAQTPAQDALTRLAAAFVEMLRAQADPIAPEDRARLDLAAERLTQLAGGRSFGLEPEAFAGLAAHPSAAVRAAGLRLLAASGLPLDELTEAFWSAGLASEDAGLRMATVALLRALSDGALAARGPAVRSAAFDPDHGVRLAVRPVAARLARNDPAFGEALFGAALPHLFQSEPQEGFAADLAGLVDAALRAPREAMPADQLWRLCQAQAQGARLVAADALAARPDDVFTPRRWARLVAHPFAAVRARALAVFDRHEDWFRADPVAAVGLLDTRWPQTRADALERLQRWEPSAFSVEALADLADSNDPAVQADARALLRRALAPGEGGPTLERLFEHPSPAFHLFVTELLTQESLADPDRFARFLEASRMILFRLEVGRAAKSRIWTRLAQEAKASGERAGLAMPLLAQMSLSAIERDRAPALALLRDLAFLHPELGNPLAIASAPARAGLVS